MIGAPYYSNFGLGTEAGQFGVANVHFTLSAGRLNATFVCPMVCGGRDTAA
jgi:hypothetical protein